MHVPSITVCSLFLLSAWSYPTNEPRQAGTFTFYPLPSALSGPCDLATGPDGALWGQDLLLNHIFRLDPTTGNVDDYPIPFTTPLSNQTVLPGLLQAAQDRTALSCAIRAGRDGNMYAANGLRNQLVRINPTTKAIQVFEQTPVNPAGNAQPFNDLYSAADGIYVTQTTGNVFQFFSFQEETFTTYQVPTPAALPLGLYVASNGVVYVAEFGSNKILTFDPTTKAIHEYALPVLAQFPTVVRAEKDGYVYFSLFVGDGIGRINIETHQINVYHTNQIGGLGSEDTIDNDGGVWLSFFGTGNALARLDTKTLEFSYVDFPNSFAAQGGNGVAGDIPPYVDIAVNYGPTDSIWFTSIQKNEVGRYSLS